MYTHAKEIGRKSDGWGRKSYDAACSSPDVVKYMAIFVYAPCFAHFNPKQNPLF